MRNRRHTATKAVAEFERASLVELMLGRSLEAMDQKPSDTPDGSTALAVENLTIPGIVDRFSM